MNRLLGRTFAALIVITLGPQAFAQGNPQPPQPPPQPTPQLPQPTPQPQQASQARQALPTLQQPSDSFNELVRAIVLQNMPHDYVNLKKWGGTKRVWDGLHIWRDGLRIKTKRRWKQANHGTWKRYRAWLINPDREFDVEITNLRKTESGSAAFDLIVVARLGAFARLSEWQLDVQLLSIGIDAEAKVRLRMSCELSASIDPTVLPPDVILHPKITDAEITLLEFRVHRISDVHGAVARELGDALREVLEDELEDRRQKLVRRMNEQIQRHPERLRLSMTDLAKSGWHKVSDFLNFQ